MELPQLLPHLTLLLSGILTVVTAVGINYGQIANNLPEPEQVLPLLRQIGATKVKLFDADPKVLKAFANSGLDFIVCVHNEDLSKVKDPVNALAWVKSNVQVYLPATRISTITVGNEILTFNDNVMSSNLLSAMEAIYGALLSLGLEKEVSVTTAHSLATLEVSYPPSAGVFKKDLEKYVVPILDFHLKTGSTFLINAYPYFAYKGSPKEVPIDFVLFQPNQGVIDPSSGLKYDNMLFAQIDAVYAALGKLGYGKLNVQISETGWPSKGDEDEAGATPENARKYNGNLIKLISQGKGTPMRPKSDLNIYVFALFNENMKPGPTSERNYGLFEPDGTPTYALGLSGISAVSNSSRSGLVNPGASESSSTGYLNISYAMKRCHCGSTALLFAI